MLLKVPYVGAQRTVNQGKAAYPIMELLVVVGSDVLPSKFPWDLRRPNLGYVSLGEPRLMDRRAEPPTRPGV